MQAPMQTYNANYFHHQHPGYLKWLTVAALLAVLALGALHPANARNSDTGLSKTATAILR